MIEHKSNQYGWTTNAKGKVVEHEAEQATIKAMLEFQSQGMGTGYITTFLNELGHRPRRGNSWTSASVRNILDRVQAEADEKAGIIREAEEVFDHSSLPGPLGDEPFTCPDGSVISIPKGSAETLRKSGRVLIGDGPEYADLETNKIKRGDGGFYTVETFKDLEARKLAEERLTVLERAERIRFENPEAMGTFGVALRPEVIGQFALMSTAEAMKTLQALIDRVEGQPSVKRDLRREVKHLFRELAAERQFRCHLLDRLQTSSHVGVILGHDPNADNGSPAPHSVPLASTPKSPGAQS